MNPAAVIGARYGAHCHMALAPKPWMRRSEGRAESGDRGAQQRTTVPSGRETAEYRRPAEAKERW